MNPEISHFDEDMRRLSDLAFIFGIVLCGGLALAVLAVALPLIAAGIFVCMFAFGLLTIMSSDGRHAE